MGWFADKPGLWFVVATLLPLASFVVLLLAAGVRRAVFRAPDVPSPVPAYVATGAMALAFVVSLIGGLSYLADFHTREKLEIEAHSIENDSALNAKQKEERAHPLEVRIESLEDRWRGNADFANIRGGIIPAWPATVLQIGFQIDTLSVVMFLMVTFIGTLIHVYSIGYMGDELQPTVEDHQVHTPPVPPPETGGDTGGATCSAAGASADSFFICRCSVSRCSIWCSPTTSFRSL